ncbi:MAG: ATP-binding protein [Deltaproteobacteria bacterium]|nr:ATP-binding protein [Deltaproteobacteria bacterium]
MVERMPHVALPGALRDCVRSQRRELELRLAEPYVERELFAPVADDDLIKVIVGPRRAGKSFFALRLVHGWGSYGYLNLDDERLAGLHDTDRLVAALDEEYGRPRHLLLDEIQNLPRWELFVNRLQRQGRRLVITGSNAHLLSRELATHLTGRHVPISIFPFSFGEYLRARGGADLLTTAERVEALRTYADCGGLPEPLVKKIDGRSYAAMLVDAVVYKDVVRRARIRGVRAIEDLALYLLSNVGTEYSLRRLAQAAGCGSEHTAQKYLGLLEEAFLVFSLRRFSFKVREQLRANPKSYCVDNGLATARGFRASENLGRLCENLVAVRLLREQAAGRARVFFWKSAQQDEVDFVVQRGRQVVEAIQVAWDATGAATHHREVRALVKTARDLRCSRLLLLTASARETTERVQWRGASAKIRLVPLWRWLLDPELPTATS